MIAVLWDVDAGEPLFYEVYGHCFGLVSSVTNFNRVPHALSVFAALLFAAPVDHFFDDYLTMDLVVGRASAQMCLDALHNAVRFELEPTKRKRSAQEQVELGVHCDLRQAASKRAVYLSPTSERVAALLDDLRACERRGTMTPHEAEQFFGRVNFVLTTAAGAVGRGAAQPLLQRAHRSGDGNRFTPSMVRMLRFYEAVLPRLPPLELAVAQHSGDHVVVYTDACYTEGGYSGIGIVIVDGGDVYEASATVPRWLLDWLRPRGQQINHLEAIAMVCARLTFPRAFARRRVVHFVDNTVAMSKAVHGYANEPDMAAAANALHACDAALGCDAWYEWVPSGANISDLPSRDPSRWSPEERAIMARLRARMGERTPVAAVFPSAEELDSPLAMLERARALEM
jgi:hypothetical protein